MVRWLLRGAATLVTLVLLAALALLLLPTERVARLAADRIAAATGRAVTVEGPVRATLWPRLGVRAEGVAVANADWASEAPMLRASSVEIGVALASLLGGDVRVETLEVDGATIVLERREDGTGNWEVDAPVADGPVAAPPDAAREVAPAGDGSARGLTIDSAALRGADVTWIDRASGRSTRLRSVDLETRFDGLDAPVSVAGSGLAGDLPFEAAFTAAALRPLLDGALSQVTATLAGGGTALAFDGRVDLDPPSVEGLARVSSDDGFALAAALGLPAPDLPRGLGSERVAVDAALTLTPAGTIHLRDMVADLDGNRLTGAVDVDPTGARPWIVATLTAERLDLDPASASVPAQAAVVAPAPDGAAPAAAADPSGWSRASIDVAWLFAADADVTLAAGPVAAEGLAIDSLDARLALEDGRAVVTLQPLRAFGGTITGDVVVNARGGLSARAVLDVTGLALQPFLTAFAGTDRLVGTADLSIDLLGVGDTQQALMEGLEGSVALRVGRGEVLGLDVAGMVRTRDLGYRGEGRRTAFDGLSVSAAVADGIARSGDLALDARPHLTATGEGTADLGARSLAYRLTPTLRAEADGAGLTVPILIDGPWDDLRIRPDLEGLAQLQLEAGREALEARAVDEVRQRLADELEVAPEALVDRGAVEDAIRSRVEDKLLELLQGR